MFRVLFLSALAAGALAACGDDDEREPPPPSRGGLPAVSYSKVGGLGGVTTKLTIGAGGRAVLDGFAFALSDHERDELVAAAGQADFAANAGHDRGDAHPDAFVYSLRVDGRDVLLRDYVILSAVWPFVAVLDRLAANHSAARRQDEADARKYLVVLYRSGGVAGGQVSLKVGNEGNARIALNGEAERTFTVGDERLALLVDALQGDPRDLESPRDPNLIVADGFEYVVMTGGVTITAGDPVENPRLERLLGALGEIVESARPPVE